MKFGEISRLLTPRCWPLAKSIVCNRGVNMKHIVLIFVSAAAILLLNFQSEAVAGAYLNSAHGNSTYGVMRSSTSAGYARGNCAHCHEQHASMGGSEPAPAGGVPSGNLLFYDNYVIGATQTDGFCFQCHTDVGSIQTGGGIVNRSYSYRAGSWTADPLSNIKDAFSFTTSTTYPSSSSHNLLDIRNFINSQTWKFTSGSNPCAACHNPHAAQGDPANAGAGISPKTGTGGWMLSLPSQHGSSPVNLWGDVASEKLSNYSGSYQAPYRFGGAGSGYEPDGSATTNGSNLTDFNTFCLDCHNSSNTVYSTLLGRDLHAIDWGAGAGDLHGQPTGNSAQVVLPYTSSNSYVLACTDCHEPHGSPNIFLTRREVNNGIVTVTGEAQATSATQWASLCERCHGDSAAIGVSHHNLPGTLCTTCHPAGAFDACTTCHYHGSPDLTYGGTPYKTF